MPKYIQQLRGKKTVKAQERLQIEKHIGFP